MLNEDSDRAREERHQSEGEHPGEDEGEIGHIPVLPEPARRRHIFLRASYAGGGDLYAPLALCIALNSPIATSRRVVILLELEPVLRLLRCGVTGGYTKPIGRFPADGVGTITYLLRRCPRGR